MKQFTGVRLESPYTGVMAFHTDGNFQTGMTGGEGDPGIPLSKSEAKPRGARSGDVRSFGVAALDLLPDPLLVVDENGAVVGTNTAADRLLDELDGLVRAGSRVEARIHRENEALLRAVARMVEAGAEGTAEVLQVSRPSGLPPYSLTVAPVRAIGRRGRRAAAIFVHDPARPRVPSAARLGRLYGLTPMEGAVASELAAGCSLKEIARAHDISIQTVRGHLKQVFAKTGTHRQGELVARILSGPPPLAFEAA